MQQLILPILALILAPLMSVTMASAQTNEELKGEIQELRQEVNTLKKQQGEQNQIFIDELAVLKTEDRIPELKNESVSGLGMAASKVYNSTSKISIGGYGELVYHDPNGTSTKNSTDVYRFVPYIGYRFSDKIILNAELEFEHGGAGANDDAKSVVEFMYMDFLIYKNFNVRVGNYLIPVGITNLKHEPVYFHSISRPEVETKLIPTTWHENGILFFGNLSETFSYQLGAFNSPTAYESGATTYSPSSWIRGGRQAGAKATAEEFSGVFRFDYSGLPFTNIGGSYVHGNTNQDESDINDVVLNLWELHVEAQGKGLGFNALYTNGMLTGADQISTGSAVIGEEVEGWYATLSFDLLSLKENCDWKLPLFVRHSEYNLHKEVPSGFTKDKSLEKKITTVGVNFQPHNQVTLKADYQFRDNEETHEDNLFSMGMGFVF